MKAIPFVLATLAAVAASAPAFAGQRPSRDGSDSYATNDRVYDLTTARGVQKFWRDHDSRI